MHKKEELKKIANKLAGRNICSDSDSIDEILAKISRNIKRTDATGGSYDDTELWDEINKIKNNGTGGSVSKTDIESAVKDFFTENVDSRLDEQDKKIVEITEKVGEAIANTIDTPFTTAYWKDSSTDKVYLVKVVNGVLTVEDTDDTSNLEGLLPDRLLIWHDEFDGNSVDASKWLIEEHVDSGQSWLYYTPQNVTISNSICKLTCKKDNYVDSDGVSYTWSSGRINTSGKFLVKYGRLEAKMRWTSFGGENSAFWTCGEGLGWCMDGEIDILETYEKPNLVKSSLHYCKNTGVHAQDLSYNSKTVITTDWHIISAEIDERYIEIFLDGESLGKKDHTTLNYWLYDNKTSFNGFKDLAKSIILQLSIHDLPSDSKERYTEFDWVRVYAPKTQTSKKVAKSMDFSISEDSGKADRTVYLDTDFQKYNNSYYVILRPHFYDMNGTDITNECYEGFTITSSNEEVVSTCNRTKKGLFFTKILKSGESTITITSSSGLTYSRKLIVKETNRVDLPIDENTWVSNSSNLKSNLALNKDTGEEYVPSSEGIKISNDYINISNKTLVGYTNNNRGGITVYEYDENKNYLGRTFLYIWENNTVVTSKSQPYTLRTETKYIKYQIHGTNNTGEWTYRVTYS